MPRTPTGRVLRHGGVARRAAASREGLWTTATKPEEMAGSVSDTYVAALQHGFAQVPDGATRVGVVRRPTRWFWGQVDENVPALSPPAELLDVVKKRAAELEADGLDGAAAHNRAMADVDYDGRYRSHLDDTKEARAALGELRGRLETGEDLVLVCYENTDEKWCHRTALAERLRDGPRD